MLPYSNCSDTTEKGKKSPRSRVNGMCRKVERTTYLLILQMVKQWPGQTLVIAPTIWQGKQARGRKQEKLFSLAVNIDSGLWRHTGEGKKPARAPAACTRSVTQKLPLWVNCSQEEPPVAQGQLLCQHKGGAAATGAEALHCFFTSQTRLGEWSPLFPSL